MLRDEVVRRSAPAGGAGSRELRVGGWKRPNSGSSPPFELKWLAITNSVCPRYVNSPASGLRLASNAVLVGSMRPGLNDSCGRAPVSDDRRRRGRACRRAGRRSEPAVGAEQEDLADVAARLAAVLVVRPGRSGGTGRSGPPAAWIAAISVSVRSTSASTMPLFGRAVVVLHLLDGDQVGRPQVVDDQARQRVELRRRRRSGRDSRR